MRRYAVVAAVVCTVLMSAAIARAGLLSGDPRVCSYHDARTCAREAALASSKRAMARRENVPVWTGSLECEQPTASLLRWLCRGYHLGEVTTTSVTFVKTQTGWARRVVFPP
jgi:hypothetical protein